MDFSFKGKLRQQLSSDKEMLKAFGKERAKPLQRRLGVLKNAKNLAEVPTEPPPRCHPLKGDRKGQFAVVLIGPWRLVFEPDPLMGKGDSTKDVIKVRLLEVADYHGE